MIVKASAALTLFLRAADIVSGDELPELSVPVPPAVVERPSLSDSETNAEAATSSGFVLQDQQIFIPTPPQGLFERSAGSPGSLDAEATDDSLTIPPPDILAPDILAPEAQSPEAASPNLHFDGDDIQSLRPSEDGDRGPSLHRLLSDRYTNYRTDESSWSWLPGSGQDFGWLSFQGTTYQPRGRHTGLGANFGLHLLGGPMSSPLPPRLYDFAMGFQTRDSLSDQFSYDLATSVGVYSDFEDSARDGVRFPSHAVGMFHLNCSTDVVFGIDYLDRDDIALLPVIGVSLRDQFMQGLRFDLVFPRPRIDYLLSDSCSMYLAGSLGGGTWDIEFPDQSNQVMTYRDYRLVLGFERMDKDGDLGAWEFGYVFGRSLEFRSNPVTTDFGDAFVLQWVWRR